MTQEDNLAKYGSVFQSKAISCMLADKAFLDQAQDIIDTKHFESDAHAWIVDRIQWYFTNYRNVPSMEVFKSELDKVKHDDTLRASIIMSLKEVYRNLSSTDIQYIKNEYLKFCKNQALKNAILASADKLPSGDYDGIKAIIDKAVQAGQERNYGHDWRTDIDDRLVHVARKTVSTGWSAIDNITDGGLGPGELGVFVAPPGIGKSWALTTIGASAMKSGLNVVKFTFELSEKYMGFRYDTIFTGIEPSQVRHNQDAVRRAVDKVPGNIKIKYYPTRTCTTNTLRAYLNRLDLSGYRPDLIIVDYADLMRPTEKGEARYQDMGIVYEDLRCMAGELDIPIWTASQSQRSSMDDDIVEGNKIGASLEKLMIGDLVISLSRKQSDKLSDTGRVYMIKNRFGVDGIIFPAKINFMKGIFEVYDENSPEGVELSRQMSSSDDILQKLMKKSKLEYHDDSD